MIANNLGNNRQKIESAKKSGGRKSADERLLAGSDPFGTSDRRRAIVGEGCGSSLSPPREGAGRMLASRETPKPPAGALQVFPTGTEGVFQAHVSFAENVVDTGQCDL